MAVVNSKDRFMSKREILCKTLGLMLDDTLTTQAKKQYAEQVGSIIAGMEPTKIMEEFDIKGEFVNQNDIVNLTLYVPEEFVPVSYTGDKEKAGVTFMLTFRETK